ncbi:rhodanese-related sulfurtransferase [Prochlorococcus sp. AH-716-K03]|nr:rhodanese-related sulfurtransferase [Prochlorococcus sp. AH-716-K03]
MRQTIYKVASIYSFFSFQENLILDLKDKLLSIENTNDLSGLLIISKEGINGTICAEETVIEQVLKIMRKFIGINESNLKFSYSKTKIFKKLKIKIKNEIVTMGVPAINPSKDAGTYVDSFRWNKLIKDRNTLVIDTRNHYEVSIGSFKESINPNTKNFSEFPDWVDNNLEKYISTENSKNIAMFCTGGIRCEKATTLLKNKGYNNVFHLKGGILKYLEDMSKEESLFEGECFVFDKRVALDHKLEKGSYSICHACGMPISIEDQKKEQYIEGIQCHFCINRFTEEDRKRFKERQKQIENSKKT